MNSKAHRLRMILLAGGLVALFARSTAAELYINEIFFDPGGAGDDNRDEYIELRGTPDMSLANHYLIFLENENNEFNTGNPGAVENIFDLGAHAMGSNGFLVMRQKDNLYDNIYGGVAAATTDLINTGSGNGWGSGSGSSLGHTGEAGKVVIENSGFTAMLIRNDGDPFLAQPFLGQDLDVGNDGLDPIPDDPIQAEHHWAANWTVLDSIGVFGEFGEAFYGRTYAQVNFGPEIVGEPEFPGGPIFETPNIEPGAVYIGLGFEIEYLGRWGNSTGQTPDDWHASNLTDNPLSGSTGVPDFRQSAEPHGIGAPDQFLESSRGVPYGKPLNDTLGAPNYPGVVAPVLPGDYNGNGVVDAADYTVWRDNRGAAVALPNEDATPDEVTSEDYDVWKANFGSVAEDGSNGAASAAVPEPALVALLAIGVVGWLIFQQRREAARSARPRESLRLRRIVMESSLHAP